MTAATPSTVVLRSRRISGSASVTIDASARARPGGDGEQTWRAESYREYRARGARRRGAGPKRVSSYAVSTTKAQRLLDAIAAEIRGHVPCGFEICEQATNLVPGEGSATAPVVIVGEAPGANEDAQGRPFVGRAGRILDDLLGLAGLAREDVFITNVVKARPPGNRDPRADEVAHHLPFLDAQLEVIRPRLLCPSGATR